MGRRHGGLVFYMHYLIYKITNNLNGKIYIGQHATENLDDGYMGSGLAIKRAIKKYGIDNFTKEILYDVDDWELMDFLEELIVDEEFVARPDTYNLKTGGSNGVHHVSEETKQKLSRFNTGKHLSEEHKAKIGKANKGKYRTEEWKKKLSEANIGKGRPHSEESKKKISEANRGRRFSEEHLRNMSKARKGKPGHPHSEETKRKLSEIRKKFWTERKANVNICCNEDTFNNNQQVLDA